MNQPTIKTILKHTRENPNVKTLTFKDTTPIQPGQFYMIWLPRIDEIPMSVSAITNTTKSITYKKIGDATTHLFNLKKGDKIGIRGPFGNGYSVTDKTTLFIGGGTGIAMLAPAIEQAKQQGSTTIVIIGAKTQQELFFIKRLTPVSDTLHITTDDGTSGIKGYASDLATTVINEHHIDAVLTCGPELMMKKLHTICTTHHIPFQASLERHMKCALGLCGQCSIGNGQRVCIEGPIFTGEQLTTYPDFGTFKRDATGKKILLK